MSDTSSPLTSQAEGSRSAPAPKLNRNVMGDRIAARILDSAPTLKRQWADASPIHYFMLDDLLPPEWAGAIRTAFPSPHAMTLKRSLREFKYVAAQMNAYDPLLEESVYAFQSPAVIDAIENVTGMSALEPDKLLYAGGVSLMRPGHYLNPHIDNSHDRLRRRYRVLNLLYYVSPHWSLENGGNLELWQEGLSGPATTIVSKFNRLVVMLTHRHSWHSVSNNSSDADRCCVSNYFFSPNPIDGTHYYHVTEFRGRPEQPIRDRLLRADNWLRTVIRTTLPKAFENRHFYSAMPTGDDRRSPPTE